MSLSSLKSISFQLQKHITQPVKSRNNRKALKTLFRVYTVLYICPRTMDPQQSHFSLTSRTFGFGRQIWQINFGSFGVFSAKLCFPLFNHYFYKKTAILRRMYATIHTSCASKHSVIMINKTNR